MRPPMNPTNIVFGRRENRGVQNSTANAAPVTNAIDRMLADVQALAPEITQRVAEIEAARRIPLDLVEKLRSIGIFRAFVSRSRGGLELDMPSALKIVE